MWKTFIEMGLNLSDLTPVHDTFHGVIPKQSSTPIGCIDLEVSCGSEDNKHEETLTFEVASFNIGYNYILGRPFLLKFMEAIQTAYATMKMPRLKGVITIKSDQLNTLACENTSLSHARRFSAKPVQDQVAKVPKIQGGSAPRKTSVPKTPTYVTSWTSAGITAQTGIHVASASTQPPTDQKVDNKKKGIVEEEDNKEVLVDPNDPDKKFKVSSKLYPK
jgi:hypothetical protein